jgi:hypothetical protein
MTDIELFDIPTQSDDFDPENDVTFVSDAVSVPGTGQRKVWESFEPAVPILVGASPILAKATFYGRVVGLSHPTAILFTIPFGLPAGATTIYQAGVGQITFTPVVGVTLRNRAGQNKTAGRWAATTLIRIAPNEWLLAGDTDS